MTRSADRWPARPVLGAVLRCAVVVVPVVLAVAVAIELTRVLPTADNWSGRVGWWMAVLGGSTAALLLADRAARRTLPLAVLLDLALVFPGRAPSRLRAARTTSVRELERRLATLRSEGAAGRPIDAAETLVTLVGILGLHDRRTRGHSERVRAFTDLLTAELGLDEDARVRVRWAALVHDIGKLSVPGAILNGGRDISPDDWEALRRHPDEGRRLAAGLMPWLGEWGTAVNQHHERWDGEGYPLGLAGEQIGYGARIVAVADAFDTMTSARSYSRARTAAAAREELARCAGAQFDPHVVRAFLAVAIPRISWVLGPVTWLAQLPFVAAVDRAGRSVQVGTTAAGIAGLVVIGAIAGPGAGSVPSTGHAVVADGTPRGGAEIPRALPFTAADATPTPVVTPASRTPASRAAADPTVPTASGTSPRVSPHPSPRPSPSPTRTAVTAPSPVTYPVGAPAPAPVPVVAPVPAPVPAPPVVTPPTRPGNGGNGHGKRKHGKNKDNGHGNGHFGENNASHSAHWPR
jgi:hypothetical protein